MQPDGAVMSKNIKDTELRAHSAQIAEIRELTPDELDLVSGGAIYMKFGGIDGQVTTEGFDKWIDLSTTK
jgi:hypothetical protein